MRSFNKDHLFLLGGLGAILIVLQTSQLLGTSLGAASVLVGALGCAVYVSHILFLRPIFECPASDPSDVELVLGEVIRDFGIGAKEIFKLNLKFVTHILVTGVTRAGKSTFIRRFVEQIRMRDLGFLYVDFKSEKSDHDSLISICKATGDLAIPQTFDLSDPTKCLTCNPLILFESVEETVGFIIDVFFEKDSNPYYKAEAERFLRHSLELLDAAGVTRTFLRVSEILSNKEGREAYLRAVDRPSHEVPPFLLYFHEEFSQLQARDRSERFSGFSSLLSSFTSKPLARIFNAETNELELTEIFSRNQSLIIRIPGEAYGELSRRIVRAIIKTLPILLSRRRQQAIRKDYFILLDEGCSYASEVLADLTKKAGSAQVKILLTRMSDADFLDVSPGFLGKMLSSFTTHVCFHTTDPDTRETLARISMTIEDRKQTYRLNAGAETGDASEREVQRFRNHPSEFGLLGNGECIIMSLQQRLFKKVKIYLPDHEQEKLAA